LTPNDRVDPRERKQGSKKKAIIREKTPPNME
jgi:hypothetical protein